MYNSHNYLNVECVFYTELDIKVNVAKIKI